MNLRERNADTSSDAPCSQSRFRKLEEFFEKNQFPSAAEMKEVAKKTNSRYETVFATFKKRRERLQKEWDDGTLRELPWQMKRLQESLEDGKRTSFEEKDIHDLRDELGIDEKHIRDFFARQLCPDSHAASHRQLLAQTMYPSERQLKAEAEKTFRTYQQVHKWFRKRRDTISKDFKAGKLKELPRQMKVLYEKYEEKPYITQNELEALVETLNIEPKKIITFFHRNRQNERNAGKKVMKEKDVPTLCHKRFVNYQPCKNYVDDSDEKDDDAAEDSEDENVEDVDKSSQPCSSSSLSKNRKTTSKPRQGIEEEEDEFFDDDNEPPRKKRAAGRRQIGRIREDEGEFDEMADDWELPLNRRLGRAQGQTRDIDYDPPSPQRASECRHQSRTSVSPVRYARRQREDAPSVHAITEADEKCHRLLKGLGEARVRVHGEQFRDVVLPFNLSVDWENWTSAQTVEVADQLFPPRAVEFFKKSGVHSRLLYMFIDEIEGIYEGLEDHNENGHFTRGMFDAFGDNIRKINELMKEKAAGTSTSSRSGHDETSSSTGTFKAPSHPAPRNRPASQNPTGPMRNWTDEQCLQLARQFVPKKTLAVFKAWGLGRQKLLKIAEKDEESFEQLRTLDVDLNDKETLTWRMFEEFGEYIRAMQVMEWKLIEEDERQSSIPSRPPSTMSAALSLQDIVAEIKEEMLEQDEERVPATVLFTPGRS